MYGTMFKALEERANAAGLFIETTVVSVQNGALSLVLTDENGHRMQRFVSLNDQCSIEKAHEKLFVTTLCEYFGEEIPEEEEKEHKSAETEKVVAEEIDQQKSVQGPAAGFAIPEEEEHPDTTIATPEELPAPEAIPEDDDFDCEVRVFACEKDKRFSALIANPVTREKMKKLMALANIRDPKAIETQVKGSRYLKNHGITL